MKIIQLLSVLVLTACSALPMTSERSPASAKVEPLERFEERLKKYEFPKPAPRTQEAIIQYFSSESLRNNSMQLEGLSRIYEDSRLNKHDIARIKDFHKAIKKFEDTVGVYSLKKETLKNAKALNAPKELIQYAQEQADINQDKVYQLLGTQGWIPSPENKVAHLIKELSKTEFQKPKKDLIEVQQLYLKRVIKTRKKIKELKPFIFKNQYSHDDLEAGMHEFRRTVRWLTIIIQALRGAFAYSEFEPKDLEFKELNDKFKDNKYFVLAPSSDGHIVVDKMPFLRLSKIISELGVLKDIKEAQIELAEGLIHSGLIKDRKAALAKAVEMVALQTGPMKIKKKSQEIYNYYIKHDPLKEIIERLTESLK